MLGETFVLIVFQRQLFGSYLQLARRGWLLEPAGPPHRPRPTRFRVRPNLTLTYPRNGTASTTLSSSVRLHFLGLTGRRPFQVYGAHHGFPAAKMRVPKP
jgi:hypothetical protein